MRQGALEAGSEPSGGPGERGRRQRAESDPAGSRPGAARAGRRPGHAVIVRIATEGQYEVADTDVAALNELDNAAVTACEAGDGSGFADVYAQLCRKMPMAETRPAVVGNQIDWAALVPLKANISSAAGSFDRVTGVKFAGNSRGANTYSLQVNTNVFATSRCNGHPSCGGWQQFVYRSNSGINPFPNSPISIMASLTWSTGCSASEVHARRGGTNGARIASGGAMPFSFRPCR